MSVKVTEIFNINTHIDVLSSYGNKAVINKLYVCTSLWLWLIVNLYYNTKSWITSLKVCVFAMFLAIYILWVSNPHILAKTKHYQ